MLPSRQFCVSCNFVTAGLREAKRRATRRALSQAAQELVLARGLDVTVEEIAAAAGVSVRTFSNYFRGKDEAIVGVDPGLLTELADELRGRPADESPGEALQAVLLADPDAMLRRWELRNELVAAYPALLPRYLASTVQLEEALTAALAERLGVDQRDDPTPRVFVAAAVAVLRATMSWWRDRSDHATPLPDALERAFRQLISQLPVPQ